MGRKCRVSVFSLILWCLHWIYCTELGAFQLSARYSGSHLRGKDIM